MWDGALLVAWWDVALVVWCTRMVGAAARRNALLELARHVLWSLALGMPSLAPGARTCCTDVLLQRSRSTAYGPVADR